MKRDWLNREQGLERLRKKGVRGTPRDLEKVVELFGPYADMLEAAAAALCELADGDANELDNPKITADMLKHLVRAGSPEAALKLYVDRSGGGYAVLGRKRCQFTYGREMASALMEVFGTPLNSRSTEHPEGTLPDVAHDWAMFLIDLGELATAESVLRSPLVSQVESAYRGSMGKALYQFIAQLNLCDVLVLTGRLGEAEFIADMMIGGHESDDIVDLPSESKGWGIFSLIRRGEGPTYRVTTGFNPYARRAVARTLQGRVNEALADFKQAEGFQHWKLGGLYRLREHLLPMLYYESIGQETPEGSTDDDSKPPPPLLGQAALCYGLLLTRLGKLRSAEKVLDYNRRWGAHPNNHFPGVAAFAGVALSDVYRLMGDPARAMQQLEHPLQWAADAGQKEIACWSRLSLARAHLAQGELAEAQAAVDEALDLAKQHRFLLYEIDCRVTQGRIAFLNQSWKTAREHALEALYAAADPECGYAWGHGNALHLLAEMHAYPSYRHYYHRDRIENLNDAEGLVKGAIKIRERIRDPRLANSQELLAQIVSQKGA